MEENEGLSEGGQEEATDIEASESDDSVMADVMAAYDDLADAGAEEPVATVEKEEEAPRKDIERPHSWAKEHWAKFDAMDPELQQVVLQRERERETFLSRKQQEIHDRMAPISQLAKDFQDIFPDGNVSVDTLKGLLQFRREFSSNPAKVLSELQEYANTMDVADVPHPKIAELESKLNQIQGTFQQQVQQQVYAKNLDEVTSFASAKDSNGELKYPHYKDVAGDMVPLLQALRSANPHMSGQELLKDAYERATWSNSAVRQKMVEAQLKTERDRIEKEKRTRSARSASLSSRGGVSNSKSAVDPNDLVSLITAIYDGELE